MNLKDKNSMIPLVIVLVALIVGGGVVWKSKMAEKSMEETENVLPKQAQFAQVESTVGVNLASDKKKQKVTIDVDHVPADVTLIEYELTYTAKGGIKKGAVGEIEIADVKGSVTADLGTCSSGTCVYDNEGSNVNLSLKFTGSKGVRVFEKEFEL